VRISTRLNDRKDATLIKILTTLPERERSETVRAALRRFFGIPLRDAVILLKGDKEQADSE
jgi:hypothetical protein